MAKRRFHESEVRVEAVADAIRSHARLGTTRSRDGYKAGFLNRTAQTIRLGQHMAITLRREQPE
jgi:hypothetical protein